MGRSGLGYDDVGGCSSSCGSSSSSKKVAEEVKHELEHLLQGAEVLSGGESLETEKMEKQAED